jgi:cell fate regulator YaaT (PSP1 superfamily)
MGCSSGGCSSGGCSTGGCNKKNVFDWFSNIQFASGVDEYNVVEISFRNGTHKGYFINEKRIDLLKEEFVVVEGSSGYDIGKVSLRGELVKMQMKKNRVDPNKEPLQKILRKAEPKELEIMDSFRSKEKEAMIKARLIARNMKLDMKISEVEFQADGKKATFYFIADDRIDFRELVKKYVAEFKVKIEMKHIGARQEAARIGGIGSCGRELCCSTWLNDFPSVTTNAARYQNLSINVEKLSGQCGRLKCCLNYELSQYVEAVREFPTNLSTIETEEGTAIIRKTEILKRQYLLTYKNDPASDYYKLTLEDVKKIVEMNKKGQKPASLASLAIKEKVVEAADKDEDLVGQIQLKTIEKSNKKNNNNKNRNRNRGNQNGPSGQINPNQNPNKNQNPNQNPNSNQGPRPPHNPNRRNPNHKNNNNKK